MLLLRIESNFISGFRFKYYNDQTVTCQSFSNLLSLLSDEHPKHKSSHYKVLLEMPIHDSLLEKFCIMHCIFPLNFPSNCIQILAFLIQKASFCNAFLFFSSIATIRCINLSSQAKCSFPFRITALIGV